MDKLSKFVLFNLHIEELIALCCYFDIAQNNNVNNEYYIFYSSSYNKLYNKLKCLYNKLHIYDGYSNNVTGIGI